MKRKASNIDILENMLIKDQDSSLALVTKNRERCNAISPTNAIFTQSILLLIITSFGPLPKPTNNRYYSLTEATMVYKKDYRE